MAFTDVCGICNTVPANWGSIFYTGVQRCGLCLDWEYDNADPLYLEFLDKGGAHKGHGKGTVTTTIARTLEGYMATPEPPKRIPRARLKTITTLCLRTQVRLFPKGKVKPGSGGARVRTKAIRLRTPKPPVPNPPFTKPAKGYQSQRQRPAQGEGQGQGQRQGGTEPMLDRKPPRSAELGRKG